MSQRSSSESADLQRLSETLDALPIMAFTVDAGGEIIYVNRAWREFTGIPNSTPADAAWRRAFDRVPADKQSFADTPKNTTREFEAEMLRRDGCYRRVRV